MEGKKGLKLHDPTAIKNNQKQCYYEITVKCQFLVDLVFRLVFSDENQGGQGFQVLAFEFNWIICFDLPEVHVALNFMGLNVSSSRLARLSLTPRTLGPVSDNDNTNIANAIIKLTNKMMRKAIIIPRQLRRGGVEAMYSS